jgi:hypothetical protein
MFHFPAFPPHTLFHSGAGNWTQLQLGFPIRTSPDQRSVANSPGHIAGSHVLHRLSMPRHPPCALTNLPHKPPTHTTKHLPAHRTVHATKNDQDTKRYTTLQTTHTVKPRPKPGLHGGMPPCVMLASTIQESNNKKPNQRPHQNNWCRRLMPQTPNSAPYNSLAH